jgi:small-conductance mechanosensitive channel/CRP-like cAMP-binding protein
LVTGLLLLAAAVLLRSGSANRHVRARLLVSAAVFAVHAAAAAAVAGGLLTTAARGQVALGLPLLLAFGAINGLVALAINPWRSDRLPDRFPTIVQDSIVIALFAVAAAAVLQERLFAATAVSAVVIGLALQDTLGNFFAGLAIQIEKPFRVGDWVHIVDTDGLVTEITWRATKLRTKAGNFLVVPNAVLSKNTVMNYSQPALDTRIQFDLGVSYAAPPNHVKETILAAIRDEPLLSAKGAEVLVVDFGESAIVYRVRMWIADFAADDRARDRVRTAIYYAFRRAGIEIPFPIRTVVMKPAGDAPGRSVESERVLAAASIFAGLPPEQLAQIAAGARRQMFAAGEAIVRQGEAGRSMFVIADGEAAVLIEPGREIARIRSGGFFGEMSLLTGAPRTATVRTVIDSEVLEIAADDFRAFVLANPAAVDLLAAAVEQRQAELERARADSAAPAASEAPQRLVARIRRFFGLLAS